MTQRALSSSLINLDCAAGSTAIYNTTVESKFSSNDQPPTPHSQTAMIQFRCHRHPCRPYFATTTTYFLRSSDPSTDLFARPSARSFPFLLDFDLRETFFRRPPSCVLFFARLQYRLFLDDFNTEDTCLHYLSLVLTFGRPSSQPSHFL